MLEGLIFGVITAAAILYVHKFGVKHAEQVIGNKLATIKTDIINEFNKPFSEAAVAAKSALKMGDSVAIESKKP